MSIAISLINSVPAFPQSSNLIQLIPTQDDSQIGRLRIREKKGSGNDYIDLIIPNSLPAKISVTIPSHTSSYTLVGLQVPGQIFTEMITFGKAGDGTELARFQRSGSSRYLSIYETISPDNFMTVNATGPLTFDSTSEIRFARSGVPVWMFADDVAGNGRYVVGTYVPGSFPLLTPDGKFQIYTSNPSTIGLTVMGATGQTGELVRIRKFDNTGIFGVRGNGRVTVGNCSGSLQTMTICPDGTTGNGLAVRENGIANSIIQSWTDPFGNSKVYVGSGGDITWVGQPTPPFNNFGQGGIYFDSITQKLKYYENGGPWTEISGGGVTLPVIDTTAIVYDNSDNTKRVRLEASSVSSGITRALTVQDADYTLAGVNLPNTYTVNQILGTGVSLLPQTANQGNIGITSNRFSGGAFYQGLDIRNGLSGSGTGYVAANRFEVHNLDTGALGFWTISYPLNNELRITNPSGLVAFSINTALAGFMTTMVSGSLIPQSATSNRHLGLPSARWQDLNMSGSIDGATNIVYNTGNQSIGGNKTFTADTYLAGGVTLGCSTGNGNCNVGVSGARPRVNAHYLGVNGSVFVASGDDNSIVFGTISTVYVGGTAVYDGTTTCGAGEAITSATVSKGLIISLTCSTP